MEEMVDRRKGGDDEGAMVEYSFGFGFRKGQSMGRKGERGR
jgi:hypothetical protein